MNMYIQKQHVKKTRTQLLQMVVMNGLYGVICLALIGAMVYALATDTEWAIPILLLGCAGLVCGVEIYVAIKNQNSLSR
jgi:hypothetical protein